MANNDPLAVLDRLKGVYNAEPVASISAGIMSLVTTLVAGLPVFGVDIDFAQQLYIILALNGIVGIGTLVQRSKVTPTEKANDVIQTAFEIDPNAIGAEPPVIK